MANRKKIKEENIFYFLPAISVCSRCKINTIPYLNFAMCKECATKLKVCEACGQVTNDCICGYHSEYNI